MNLSVRAVAFSCAVVWGIAVFILAWWLKSAEYGAEAARVIGSVYRGFEMNLAGSLIGFVWGFLTGLAGGALYASIYNLLVPGTAEERTTQTRKERVLPE